MADIKTVQLIVNAEKAQSELTKLNKKLEVLEKKREEALDMGDASKIKTYTSEIKKTERQMQKMQTRAQTVKKTLHDLDKATPKELKNTIKAITEEMNSGKIKRGSQEWEKLNEALRECNGELKKIKEEGKAVTESLRDSEKGIAGFGNKWVGIIGSIQMGWELFDRIKNSMGEYVDAYLNMAEAESQVIKYTGMTAEEVAELNEAFKKMDTRTPREQLNALAGDAGRLGITGKDAVLDFVEAADMINVALGEDLGENAVKNIGKLAQLFDDDDKMGLKQAMLATGSTINQLGQTSSASEGYIVEFSGRLASMAKQAGMTQAQVMGLAAVLDQGMVNAEQGSTALSTIIQKLYKDPQKMAKAVGLDVKQFTDLLKKDANAALLQFSTAVSKMGGMEAVAPLLGDLKLAGAGVSKTLATLAGNIDLVRSTQDEANRAFQEGTSIIEENAKANATPLAQQEKLAKKLNDLKEQLGKELYPIWQSGMGLTTTTIGLLSTLISFVGTYGKQILALTALLSSYKIAVIATTAATKAWALITGTAKAVQMAWNAVIGAARVAMIAYTYGMRGATMATRAFTTAMKANPWGLIATVVTSAVALIWSFADATEEATEKVDDLRKIQDRAAESTAEERSRIENLTGIIRSNTATYEAKKKAIEALRKIIPGYTAELDEQGRVIKENTKAIDDYIKGLNRKALATAAEAELTELAGETMKAEMKLSRKKTNVKAVERELKKPQYQKNMQTVTDQAGYRSVTYTIDVNQQARVEKQKELLLQQEAERAAQAEVDALKTKRKHVEDWLKSNPDVLSAFNGIVTEEDEDGGGGGGGGTDDTPNPAKVAKDTAELERLKATLQLKMGEMTQEQYKEAMIKAEEDLIVALRGIYPEGSKERTEAELDHLEAVKKHKKSYQDWSIQDIERQEREEQQVLKRKYADGEISEKEYRDALTDIQASYLRRKAAFAEKEGNTEEAAQYTAQAEEAELQQKLQRRQQYEQQAQKMQQQYLQKSIAERRQAENDLLTELIQAGVIAEEKEQEYRDAIKKKFDEEEKKEKKDDKWGNIGGQMDPMTSSIVNVMTAMDNLSQKIKDGKANWSDYAGAAIGALGMVSAMMSSASNYMQACYQAEEAKVTKRYDAEIKAAGANTKKGKQLEEKKQKELAALKAKYNKKAMTIEIAQAVASTAMAAINAYASAAKVNFILGPIAAAAATAAGMLQIATIKKQHEAQAAGYYEGGFTGGNSYRRTAGVVHEGEFVANHKAVNNPNVLPVLKMLDYAQRNNTIASVTSADIANAAGGGQAQTIVTPVVVHETERTSEALERLNENLERGIRAKVSMDGEDGVKRNLDKYNKLLKNL